MPKPSLAPSDDVPTQVKSRVHDAVRSLADRCDGANSLDGEGFNKYDTDDGHYLAEQQALDHDELLTAARLVIKYQRQLDEDDLKAAKQVLAVLRD